MILDIGSERIPKDFDNAEDPLTVPVKIGELALVPVQADNDGFLPPPKFDEEILIVEMDDGDDFEPLDEFFSYVCKAKCIVSHNAETDLKLLDQLHRLRYGVPLAVSGEVYCTMQESLPFSRLHIWSGGKKIKKWLTLRQLYTHIFSDVLPKGDIIDDVVKCWMCAAFLMRQAK